MGVGVTCPVCRVVFAFYCKKCRSYDTEIHQSLGLINYFQSRSIYYLKCLKCQSEYDDISCPSCNTHIIPESPFVQGDKGGGNRKKCFIATACTEENSQIVIQLCSFRDEVLEHFEIGKQIVRYYYFYSPKLADFIQKRSLLKVIVKYCLIFPIYFVSFAAVKIFSFRKVK